MRITLLILLVCSPLFQAVAQVQPAASNAEILQLLEAKMPESVVMKKIQSMRSPFDTSSQALVQLKKAGATENELNEILSHTAGSSDAATTTTKVDKPPADEGPGFEETFKFIDSKLNAIGTFNYSTQFHNTQDPNEPDMSIQDTFALTNVTGDPVKCKYYGHFTAHHFRVDFKVKTTDEVIDLRKMKGVAVEPLDNLYKAANVNLLDGVWVFAGFEMPLTAVEIQRENGDNPYIVFTDAEQADKVARAINHAAELCGNKPKKEPF